MAGNSEQDDRSMSEILASIRKIVTDEEESRRSAADDRRRTETSTGAEVFVLTGEMRTEEAATPADDAPLDVGTAATPAEPAEPELTARSMLTEPPLELTPTERADAPLDLGTTTRIDIGSESAAVAASAAAASTVDFPPAPALTEEEITLLIRKVLREELQGPVGQQISRKVKAMIHDEVAKALLEEESLL